MAARTICILPGFNANTVILNGQTDRLLLLPQRQVDLLGMGMSCNIHQCFLGNPQERHFDAGTQAWNGAIRLLKFDLDIISRLYTDSDVIPGRFESIIIEHSGAQVGHHITDQSDRFRHQFH